MPIGAPGDDGPGDDHSLGQALAADAFWGESSASLHEAIEAPRDDASVPLIASGRHQMPDAPNRVHRRSRRAFDAGLRSGGSVLVAVGVLVACCLAVGVAIAAHVGGHRASSNLAFTPKPRVVSAAGGRPVSTESARLSQLVVEQAIERASRGANDRRRGSTHDRASAAPRVRPRDKALPTTLATVSSSVGTDSEASPVGLSSSTAASSDTGSEVEDSSPPIAGQSSTGTGSGSSSSSGSAGPVGAGAPFGPGQMTSSSG